MFEDDDKKLRKWKLNPFGRFWVVCSIGFNIPCFYDCLKSSLATDELVTMYVMILIVGVMSITAVCTHVLTLLYYENDRFQL